MATTSNCIIEKRAWGICCLAFHYSSSLSKSAISSSLRISAWRSNEAASSADCDSSEYLFRSFCSRMIEKKSSTEGSTTSVHKQRIDEISVSFSPKMWYQKQELWWYKPFGTIVRIPGNSSVTKAWDDPMALNGEMCAFVSRLANWSTKIWFCLPFRRTSKTVGTENCRNLLGVGERFVLATARCGQHDDKVSTETRQKHYMSQKHDH